MKEIMATLLSLEQGLREQDSLGELAFFITHQTRLICEYQRAVAWSSCGKKAIQIESISQVVETDHNSPFQQELVHLVKTIYDSSYQLIPKKIAVLKKSDFENTAVEWPTHWPELLLILPFHHEKILIGGLLLVIVKIPEPGVLKQLEWLCDAYSYAWRLLNKKAYRFSQVLARIQANQRSLKIAGIILFLSMFIRLPQTVMAPVTVIPKDPVAVTAPLDGAVEKVYVKPDQEVAVGALLVSMEKRDLENQYELAVREFDTAKAKVDSAIQTGFKNVNNRADIQALQMELKEKQLKAHYADYLLKQADIKATAAGIAIIDNPDRWVGRPVGVGEKILLIGQRDKIQFEISLPVADAIAFEPGDLVKVYLTEDPLNALQGQILYSSFDATLTPKQVLAYRVIADFNADRVSPHIGSQGTAKIIGKRVSFFYYLLRRPIGYLRQSFGW